MKTSSAKAKGRDLQKYFADTLLQYNQALTINDVRSTSMGAQGVDVQLSENALYHFPFAIECKSYAKFSVYEHFKQAQSHIGDSNLTPLLVIKQNRSKPLVVLDLDDFMNIFHGEADVIK